LCNLEAMKNKSPHTYGIGFYILYAILFPVSVLPACCLKGLSVMTYWLAYYVFGYRKAVVLRNLQNAFPRKTMAERQQLAKQYFKHLSELIWETVALMTISAKRQKQRLQLEHIDIVRQLYDQKKIVFIAWGHYGNWEVVNIFHDLVPYFCMPIYKPLSSRSVDDLMYFIRSRHGAKPVKMRDSLKEFLAVYRKKEHFLGGFITDQTPTGNEINFWTTFLNQETPVFLGMEKLAKKMGAAVVFMDMKKQGFLKYKLVFHLITENATQTEPYEITLKHTKLLEDEINEAPAYWLWSHRRWKHKRKKGEPVWPKL